MTTMPTHLISEMESIRERKSSVEDICLMFTGNSLIETEEQVQLKIRNYRKLPTFRNTSIDEVKLLETPRKKKLMCEWFEEEKRNQQFAKSHTNITQNDAEIFLSLCEVNQDSVSNIEWLDWVQAIQGALNKNDSNEDKENQAEGKTNNTLTSVESNNNMFNDKTLQNTLANSSQSFDFAKTQSVFGAKALSPSRKNANKTTKATTKTNLSHSSNQNISHHTSTINNNNPPLPLTNNQASTIEDLPSSNHTTTSTSASNNLNNKYAQVAAKLEIDGLSRDFYGTPLKEVSRVSTPFTGMQEWSSGINGFKRPTQLSTTDEFTNCNTIKKLFTNEGSSQLSPVNTEHTDDLYHNQSSNKEDLLRASAIVSSAQVFTTKYRRSPQNKLESQKQSPIIKVIPKSPKTSPQKNNITNSGSNFSIKIFITTLYWLLIFCCCYYATSWLIFPRTTTISSNTVPLIAKQSMESISGSSATTISIVQKEKKMATIATLEDNTNINKSNFNPIAFNPPSLNSIHNELELLFNPWKSIWVKIRKIFTTAVQSVQAQVLKVPFHNVFNIGKK